MHRFCEKGILETMASEVEKNIQDLKKEVDDAKKCLGAVEPGSQGWVATQELLTTLNKRLDRQEEELVRIRRAEGASAVFWYMSTNASMMVLSESAERFVLLQRHTLNLVSVQPWCHI